MAIDFNCSKCNSEIQVEDRFAGRKGKCQTCGTILTIPLESPPIPLPTKKQNKKLESLPIPLLAMKHNRKQAISPGMWLLALIAIGSVVAAAVWGPSSTRPTYPTQQQGHYVDGFYVSPELEAEANRAARQQFQDEYIESRAMLERSKAINSGFRK